MNIENLAGLFLFGSTARGDHDKASDVDILVVYHEQPSSAFRNIISNHLLTEIGDRAVLAEYSLTHIKKMFDKGHLFAWHLYQESIPLHLKDFELKNIMTFHEPAPYEDGTLDSQRFLNLLLSTATELENESSSAVHEAGIAYLCLRNIAMSLSNKFLPRVDFTRGSPFSVSNGAAISPPCTDFEYQSLVAARHASQRGLSEPTINQDRLKSLIDDSFKWAHQLMEISYAK